MHKSVGIGPLHYIASRSDFGFEFAEIFVIEKRLPESFTTCINPCKKVLALKSKKVIVKVSYKIYSEPALEPESQFGFDI